MAHSRVYVPKSTVINMLKPSGIENEDTSEISWTKIEKLNENTMNSPELHHHLQTNNDLPTILLQSSFQSEPNNHNRQSVLLQDFHFPQEA